MSNREGWAPLLADLETRTATAHVMGGPEKLARHEAMGRVDARERVERLVDEGSFTEIGALAGELPADGFISGFGTIDGRPVFVGVEDFSVAGGSIGIAGASKRARLARLALQERRPLVMMLEGAGHRATNALTGERPAPNDLQAMADLAGLVPTVAIVTGPSAGHGALAAPLSDFVVMVDGQAALFTAGPPLVEASLGEKVTKEDLGGPAVHAVISGVAHNVAADVDEACDMARRYLSLLPHNAWYLPDFVAAEQEWEVDELLDIIPPDARRPYDMRQVLEAVFDETFELSPLHGVSIITALARIGGQAVAIVANQPNVMAGSIDVAAANKAARFIQIADSFHLPLILLADNPGVLAGSASERAGILRAGARMFAAQHRAQVPKIHVTLRKAFGFGSSVMGQNGFDGQTLSLAFPGAVLGGIPAKVGGATSKADASTAQALIDNESAGPWRLAGSATYDAVIDPRQLRNELLAGLRVARLPVPEPVLRSGYMP